MHVHGHAIFLHVILQTVDLQVNHVANHVVLPAGTALTHVHLLATRLLNVLKFLVRKWSQFHVYVDG